MNITKLAGLDVTEQFEAEWKSQTTGETVKVRFEALKESLRPNFLKNVDKTTDYPKVIVEYVTKWDLTSDDEGTPWPLTVEAVEKLPNTFNTAILNAISESWAGDKKKQKASPASL